MNKKREAITDILCFILYSGMHIFTFYLLATDIINGKMNIDTILHIIATVCLIFIDAFFDTVMLVLSHDTDSDSDDKPKSRKGKNN